MVVSSEQAAAVDSLEDLVSDLPRGRSADYVGMPSNSHFEHPRNLLATESLRFDPEKNKASKYFLGVVGGSVVTGTRLPDGRPNRWIEGGTPLGVGTDQHLMTLSYSRGGKGRAGLVPNLILLPKETSVLCIDPKGDLARFTARWRADGLGQDWVGVLDPFRCSGSRTERFHCVYNPIEMLLQSEWRTFVANARMIADSLIVTGNQQEEHWSETARQMCGGLCAHVATHVNYEGRRDLVTVWQLASELATPDPHNPQRYWLEEEMLANDAAGGMIRAAARQFYDRTGGEFSSVLSNLRKHLDFISYECMGDVLRGDSVDLRDLKRKFVTLYVTLPALRMDALRGWMRLLVQMALVACEEERTLVGNQCVFVLDEFHALSKLSAVETAIAQVAGMGAKLHIVLQNLSQLSAYEKNYETFIANAGLVQILGCGDDTTLEYVSKRLGQALTLTRSTNSPTFEQAAKQAATGESWSLANHPLMTAEEIGRYFARDDKKLRQLILRPGYRPIIAQRAFYDKHELFRGKYDEE